MEYHYKPKGYNSVSPYIIAYEADRIVDMLKTVFDAVELRRFDTSDGTIMHIELKIDDSIIMLGNASEEFPPNNLCIHIYVKDVHKTFQEAIAYGCKAIEEPTNKDDDPDIRGMFTDASGNLWAIGTQMPIERTYNLNL